MHLSTPHAVDDRTFRKTLSCFGSGVTVITTLDPATSNPLGVTVSAFCSVSLEPPLVLACLGDRTHRLDAYRRFGHFGVNILASEQQAVSNLFASRCEDKWSEIEYGTWESGVPLIGGCLANLECALVDERQAGDHVILTGRVLRIASREIGEPLLYFRGGYR